MKINRKHKQHIKTTLCTALVACIAGSLTSDPEASGRWLPPAASRTPGYYRIMPMRTTDAARYVPAPKPLFVAPVAAPARPAPARPIPQARPMAAWAPAIALPVRVDPTKTIILDPGHGGEDEGAVVKGRREKELTLEIARKLQARLAADGGPAVRLTRDSDAFIPLDERVKYSLDSDGSIFVSLHINQVRDKRAEGIIVYSFGKMPQRKGGGSKHRHRYKFKLPPTLPNPPKEHASESARLAESIVNEFRTDGLQVKSPERNNFYVLKNPRLPSILIEFGFLTHPTEARRLIESGYQERLVEAVARGIRSYLMEKKAHAAAAATTLAPQNP